MLIVACLVDFEYAQGTCFAGSRSLFTGGSSIVSSDISGILLMSREAFTECNPRFRDSLLK